MEVAPNNKNNVVNFQQDQPNKALFMSYIK